MDLTRGTWLIAVSGGPDSMALLDMCTSAGISCAAAHVNYHHRPEAEEEEAYVRSFCRERGIPCHVKNDPFEWTGNFEAAARQYRYAFFARVVKEHGFSGVLTAHHMDDLLETYFMQEEKGIIPETWGLKEERMIEGVLVCRPLLDKTKAELEDYCVQKQIRTFHDVTNDDCSLQRNRIRHEIIDTMSMADRQLVLREIAGKNAVLQERRCRVNAWVREAGLKLPLYRTWGEEDRLTALRDALLAHGITRSRRGLQEIDAVLMTHDDPLIPLGSFLLAVQDSFIRVMETPEPYAFTVRNLSELQAVSAPDFKVEEGVPGVNAVTVKEEDWPLTVRSPKDGDRIAMRFGHKSVHRFFIDRKIPRYDRLCWPIITNCKGEVILVPGLGCDKGHYSICPSFSVLQLSRCI